MKDYGEENPKTHFVVSYRDPLDSKLVELRANKVQDSELGLSFVSISDFVFESRSTVVDPAAEDLKRKFEDVKTSTFPCTAYSASRKSAAETGGFSSNRRSPTW